jgi:hypothetical protein
MLSPSSFERGTVDLRKSAVRQLKKAKIQHQILEILDKSLNAVLSEESIILSRAERKRLLAQVTQDILSDMLQKLESAATGKKQG